MVGKTITPKQLAQQWLTLPNRFEVNVFNFETLIGNAAKKYLRILSISVDLILLVRLRGKTEAIISPIPY